MTMAAMVATRQDISLSTLHCEDANSEISYLDLVLITEAIVDDNNNYQKPSPEPFKLTSYLKEDQFPPLVLSSPTDIQTSSTPTKDIAKLSFDLADDSNSFLDEHGDTLSDIGLGPLSPLPSYLTHIPPEDDIKAHRKIIVGNLKTDVTEEQLSEIFDNYGNIIELTLWKPRGHWHATILYFNLDMAYEAKLQMSGQPIHGKICKITYAKIEPTERIWIGNLGPGISRHQLELEFNQYGWIRKVTFEDGHFAHVQYFSKEDAERARKEAHGKRFGCFGLKMRVDFIEPFLFPEASGNDLIPQILPLFSPDN